MQCKISKKNNDCKFGQDKSFISNIKKNLLNQREKLKEKIKSTNNLNNRYIQMTPPIRSVKSYSRFKRNNMLNNIKTDHGKISSSYIIDVPSFLMKSNDDPILNNKINPKTNLALQSAINRYENILKKADIDSKSIEKDSTDRADNWFKSLDLKAAQRKNNELELRKYHERQIQEHVYKKNI